MSLSDPIADMLTRIRNAQRAFKNRAEFPCSNLKEQILEVMLEEGYIRAYERNDMGPAKTNLIVELKYCDGKPVIEYVGRVSKPGKRVYSAFKDIKPFRSGLGINIVSTSKGIMSDVKAKEMKIGGELICQLY